MYISTMVAMIVMISRYFKCGELSDLGALTLSVNHISFCYAFDFIYLYENKFLKGLSLYFLIM